MGGALHLAIRHAAPGSVIHLASGAYPHLSIFRPSAGWITVTGAGDPSPPRIGGAFIGGASHLRFLDITFTHGVQITKSPYDGQPAADIEILNSEIGCGSTTTAHNRTGIMIRAGARNVGLSGDYVHNCVVGLASVAQDPVSTNITITHDTFQDFPGDAIDLGGLSHVVIDHDIIRNIGDPNGKFHDDGIQFFGNVQHVQITNNVISNSEDQLIFIQDAVKSGVTGSSLNSDILVAHNLIYGAGAWAIQSQGAVETRFVGNTIWTSHFGSLLLRMSAFSHRAPTDTVVFGNLIQGFGLGFVHPGFMADNLINPVGENRTHAAAPRAVAARSFGTGHLLGVNPVFVRPFDGHFELKPRSPARSRASLRVFRRLVAGIPSLAVDLYGRPYPVSGRLALGALQPGDPLTSYGKPLFGPSPLT